MDYKFTQAIKKAIEDCKNFGNGKTELEDDKKTVIYAEWTDLESNENCRVIEVQVYQRRMYRFSYQIDETIAVI